MFKFLSHFEFIFVYGVRECSNWFTVTQLFQHYCWINRHFSKKKKKRKKETTELDMEQQTGSKQEQYTLFGIALCIVTLLI